MASAPKTPVGNAIRPFGQAAGGVMSGLTFGAVNPVAARPQNRLETGANIAGNLAGAFSPVGFGAKVLSPVGRGVEAATTRLLPKAAKLSRIAPVVAGEVAQTATIGGLRGATNQEFNPVEDLAYGVGMRGVLRAVSPMVKGLKGYSPRSFDIHPDDQRIMKEFVNRVQGGGAKMNLEKYGVDAQRIAEHYIGKKARNLTNSQLAKTFDALLSNAAIRRGEDAMQTPFPKMGLVDNAAQQPKEVVQDTQSYIKEMTKRKGDAGSSGAKGVIKRGKNLLADLKAKLVDSTSPIEDALSSAEKKGKFKVLPEQDVRLQIDRVLRSKTLASKFAEDNGFVKVIQDAPDLNALDQYMIAKQARRVTELGKETGRNAEMDAKLITELAPQYEQHAQAVNQYSRKLLDYSVETGLIDKKLAQELVQKYPDYVPLQRVFNELEGMTTGGGGKGIASQSYQSVVKRLKGSEREIQSPIESLLLKTQTAFEQG
jgi:hypothetical protein